MDKRIDLRCGHVLEQLRILREEGVQVRTCVTSPPYWGLRAYSTEPQVWVNGKEACVEHEWSSVHPAGYRSNDTGAGILNKNNTGSGNRENRTSNICSICGAWRGELGLEPTPELYVAHLVEVFRAVRDVLADDGTLWLNLGDSYVGGKSASGAADPLHQAERYARGESLTHPAAQANGGAGKLRPTDNLRALRSIGLKAKDLVGIPWRVAFALQQDGWYLRSDIIWHKPNPMPESVTDRPTKSHEYIFLLSKSAQYYYDYEAVLEPANYDGRKDTQFKGSEKYKDSGQTFAERGHERWPLRIGRTERKMAGTGYGGDGTGLHSHSGYFDADGNLRTHEKDGQPARNKRDVWTVTTKRYSGAHFATFPPDLIEPCILAGSAVDDIVLDPFGGSGTVAQVSIKHGRRTILIDLNPKYIELQKKRLRGVQMKIQ